MIYLSTNELNEFIRAKWQSMSDSQIAQACGISIGAVAGRRRRMGLKRSRTPEAPAEPDFEKLGEVERLKGELKHLRSYVRDHARGDAEERATVRILQELVPAREPVPVPVLAPAPDDEIVESAVLLIGDLHYGEQVTARSTGGIAVYNTAVARERFNYTIDTAIEMANHHLRGYRFPKLYVFGLGDWISGLIIRDIERWNEVMPIEQTLGCAEMVEEGLLKLCQAFPEVYFRGVAGNHSRLTEKLYYHAKQSESFDYLCYKYLEARLAAQPNLHFDIPTTFWFIEQVENTRFLVMHGDMTKSWGGYNMPIYGITRDYMKWRQVAENYAGGFHNLITGHWHTPHRFNMGRDEVLVNGSLKGIDDYGLGAPRPPVPPVQMFFGVHPKHGITWDFRIKSEHIGISVV